MITIDAVVVTVAGLDRAEIEHWIAEDWVRPMGSQGAWEFGDIDVARLRLIRELRHELHLDEDALPVVLRLMDQLYDARRRLRRLRDAVERAAPPELHQAVLAALRASDAE
jgi:chaperone modulatory protein CbpM